VYTLGLLPKVELNPVGMRSGRRIEYGTSVRFSESEELSLSQRTESKEQLKKQNETLQNFAFIVSHNLKSHAGNLASILQLINSSRSEHDREKLFQYLQKISVALTETVTNLEKVVTAQVENNEKREALNLREYVERALDTLASDIETNKITVENNVAPFIMLEYIPAYMESILLNILSNAVKYRSTQLPPRIRIQTFSEKDHLVLQISDNGIGIDLDQYREKIFGLYQTFHGNPDAKGIGLFITKNQIESQGGKITVESKVGLGTSFKLYFKISDRLHV
jgi:signal transduction histidine kinase